MLVQSAIHHQQDTADPARGLGDDFLYDTYNMTDKRQQALRATDNPLTHACYTPTIRAPSHHTTAPPKEFLAHATPT